MAPATIDAFETETTETETALSESGLLQALVDQRRHRLTDEPGTAGLGTTFITFTAVDEVLAELLDGEAIDRWRARAAAELGRLGLPGPDPSSVLAA